MKITQEEMRKIKELEMESRGVRPHSVILTNQQESSTTQTQSTMPKPMHLYSSERAKKCQKNNLTCTSSKKHKELSNRIQEGEQKESTAK